MNFLKLVGCLFLGIMVLTGCATVPLSPADVTEVKKVMTPEFSKTVYAPRAEGSLWSEATGVELYLDKKARKVGDIVVVRIVEDPEASLNATTTTSKSSGINAKLKLLGYMESLAAKNPYLPQNPGSDDLINATLASDFEGSGTSGRDGHIKAYVSAVVVQMLPNGNLVINGKREVKVNHEAQYIVFSGVVRPEDISTNNEVASTYVANAQIYYSGVGAVADKQKPGWLGKVVDNVWPF